MAIVIIPAMPRSGHKRMNSGAHLTITKKTDQKNSSSNLSCVSAIRRNGAQPSSHLATLAQARQAQGIAPPPTCTRGGSRNQRDEICRFQYAKAVERAFRRLFKCPDFETTSEDDRFVVQITNAKQIYEDYLQFKMLLSQKQEHMDRLRDEKDKEKDSDEKLPVTACTLPSPKQQPRARSCSRIRIRKFPSNSNDPHDAVKLPPLQHPR